MFDVIIIGGSYAGMSAALPLVRARRKVLVIDSGLRRNRFADAAYGVLAQDGRPPGEIAAEGKRQLMLYPDLTWRDGEAVSASRLDDGFAVGTADGDRFSGRFLILATGVSDTLPDVPGLKERWGRSVFHCPYCHGYELNRGALGVLASGPISLHQAQLIPQWGPTTFFTNGVLTLDQEQQQDLAKRGVTVEAKPVISVSGERATVELADGRAIELAGLFVASEVAPAGSLAEQLGCKLDETPIGTVVDTDDFKATSIPGIFACGDTARAAGNVTLAMADGTMAAMGAHRALLFGLPEPA
ncbi:NAD(P)/FAD-dependent oxidoreductase [Alloalcanivorax xenomutans]|uniref:NAD(P)/FAD-dependent oxidoreductase n=1 Tax=Alloalcanivorax xenomutans TaxID=1094342 RepID=A0A9Q3W3X6_9GAMM|nr:NAD(P)/FAD-dependent oxidoreductase [Alloalcanivorax xenomutans]ARB47420.1 thioredoxin reductase [Alloalcanivorax xenomutans]MCE7508131.1 NAD(P)/FAD-dependent oxidoreductase [Alloalcanivorax xenomutans]